MIAWIILLLLILLPIYFMFFSYNKTPISNSAFVGKYGPIGVVLGASEGLGACYAKDLAAKGLSLVLVARNEDKLENFATEIRREYADIKVYTVALDLAETEIVIERLEKAFKQNDIKKQDIGLVIYNAAYYRLGKFLDKPATEQLKTVAVNVTGVVTLSHYFGHSLTQRTKGGGLILMSSMTGAGGAGGLTTYGSTKTFIAYFAQGLWYEYGKHKVDVLSPILGSTLTPGYLAASASATKRSSSLELTPDVVVKEILLALPHTKSNGPWIITGTLYKFFHFLTTRILPIKMVIKMMSNAVEEQLENASSSNEK